MKKIALILGMFLSHTAQADYSSATADDTFCSGMGKFAAKLYKVKESGQPKMGMGEKDPDPYMRPLSMYMEDYVWETATDADEAYRGVWAKCMDNIESISRDRKAGVKPFGKLHYE